MDNLKIHINWLILCLVYDCFMYFDEDLITEIRFNVLNDHVDKFVIVEATRDHAEIPKKLNFDVNKFKKFKDKIIYEVVEDIPEKVEKYKKGWSPNFFKKIFIEMRYLEH